MKVTIKKCQLHGRVKAIGSKSFAHRYLIAASLTNDESAVGNVPFSDDVEATIDCLSSLGTVLSKGAFSVFIESITTNKPNPVLNCRESGSTLRFLLPLSLVFYDNVTLTGTQRLIERGVSEYEKIFSEQGIRIEKSDSSIVAKGKLKPGEFFVDSSVSSQYVTGLLFALPLLQEDSKIHLSNPINSKGYIDITLSILNEYGIRYEWKDNVITVFGKQHYKPKDSLVEGDYSNAAFLAAFNYFGSDVKVDFLNPDSLQGDKVYQKLFPLLVEGEQRIDVSNCIDLAPILFVFAALNKGATFINTKRLANKESNRILAIKDELSKINICIKDDENIVEIKSQDIVFSSTPVFSSHNDHRVVMALSLLSAFHDITIDGAEAVNKSYPNYFRELEKLGAEVIYEE